jgi:hypothetical protein
MQWTLERHAYHHPMAESSRSDGFYGIRMELGLHLRTGGSFSYSFVLMAA